jgi:hypothetical protein
VLGASCSDKVNGLTQMDIAAMNHLEYESVVVFLLKYNTNWKIAPPYILSLGTNMKTAATSCKPVTSALANVAPAFVI